MSGKITVVIRGAGDLATGVAHRLFRSGIQVAMTEIASPLVIRRAVSFAEAVFEGETVVEGVKAVRVDDHARVREVMEQGLIPVVVDPEASIIRRLCPDAVVDAILAKKNLGTRITDAKAVIGLGPGFTAGVDVHAVIETQRGHNLGRVITEGQAAPDTGRPGEVMGYTVERLVRATADGVIHPVKDIGDMVKKGDVLAMIGESQVLAGIDGVLRGMIKPGSRVTTGMKIGDIDPRGVREYCFTISDKARAIGGAVLEAILSLLKPF